MPTYSATGFSFLLNEGTNTIISFSSGTQFDAVTNEAVTSFSYVPTLTTPGRFDEVYVGYAAYSTRIS